MELYKLFMESSQIEYTKLKKLKFHRSSSSNMPEMMNFKQVDHHDIDVDGNSYGGSSSTDEVNVNEDQHQPMIIGDHKTSRHKMGLTRARTKLPNIFTLARNLIMIRRDAEHKKKHIRLCEAAMKGDWKKAEEIENEKPGILSEVISKDRKETALHIATRFNWVAFVDKLVEKLEEEDFKAKNVYGNTALCIAATSGVVAIAESMVRKYSDLVLIRGAGNATPVLIAARYKHNSMLSYLLTMMKDVVQKMERDEQRELLVSAISADHYDIALVILKWDQNLALERDQNEDTPLHIMALKSNVIGTKNWWTKLQSFIPNNCLKHICKKKQMQIQARETAELMWKVVVQEKIKDGNFDFIFHPSSMLHDAASVGNVEFVRMLLDRKPELLRMHDESGKTIFHIAVENRQRHVFNLIYDMNLFNPDDLLYYFNEENVSLLELAAKRADPIHLDRVSGAVFQMHHELLWFKAVEDIIELTMNINSKAQKKTREKFTEEHRSLVKEGEEWVKNTANSCMLVAALIATVAFSAAFTVPGGNHDQTGSPIFLTKTWFTVFVISDAIALISSSTAILLFLSILTSGCIENDFIFWLPMELVFRLGALFLSVLGMVLAFSACSFLHYGKDNYWIPSVVIIFTAIVPIYWFGLLLWKLWVDGVVALHATRMSYWLKDRKTKFYDINN